MRTLLLPLAAILVLAATPSCKSKTGESETTAPPNADTAPPVTQDADEGKDPNKANVTIDPRIIELCGIDEPHFSFNSSSLSPQAKKTLDALATCFKTGKAVGKNMRLVGHTDPRGDEEYNLGLGQKRADSVGGYLKKRGLGSDRVETSSRGKMDATGSDDASWAQDRKVEILLAD
ncbi:MAG: OmpA family protein [Myxococcales bacterium]|nr:OmpA family protein [Myxococcales bacterium]MCB9703628.1 OmpA family protein [Myxococcales bacterium]